MTHNPLEAAAINLRQSLIDEQHSKDWGFIGIGDKRLLVFIHATKRRWRGDIPKEFAGYSVEWRFGVGRAVALTA